MWRSYGEIELAGLDENLPLLFIEYPIMRPGLHSKSCASPYQRLTAYLDRRSTQPYAITEPRYS